MKKSVKAPNSHFIVYLYHLNKGYQILIDFCCFNDKK